MSDTVPGTDNSNTGCFLNVLSDICVPSCRLLISGSRSVSGTGLNGKKEGYHDGSQTHAVAVVSLVTSSQETVCYVGAQGTFLQYHVECDCFQPEPLHHYRHHPWRQRLRPIVW